MWKIFAHFRRTPVPTYRLGQGYSWPLTVLRANCLFVRPEGKLDLQPSGGNFFAMSDSMPSLVRRTVSNSFGFLALAAFLLAGCTSYVPSKPVAGASLTVSRNNVNFATVVLGQTVNQTLHVSNSGTAPLQITKLTVSDSQFVITGPSVPRVVLPNLGLDYTLAFTPTTPGSATGLLTIQSNAIQSAASVSLAGVGEKVMAMVAVSPAALNFGNLNLQTTATKSVTLQNTGDVNVAVSGITVAGSGFGYSDLSPGFSLAPSQSVTFQVWFRPQVKGAASGTVSIISANLSSPASLALAGDGVSPTTTAPSPTPPATPTAVQQTVNLSWNPSTSAIVGYYVYRSQSASGGFQKLSASPVDATNYTDSTVNSGTTYYYAVTAVNASGEESVYSNESTAVVPAH